MIGPKVLVWLRLFRICQKIDRAQHQNLRSWGLNVAQFDVLTRIGTHPGITQQELANILLVTKGNISQLLDRMEKMELIKRTQEKRSNTLSLTEQGRALYARVVPAHEELIAAQFSALSSDEVADLQRLLRILDHALH
jgi:DNA-binding MarR family transcriptional regulator